MKKRLAVGIGILMGVGAAAFAMVPTSHHGEAAVAVIDQQNIEEAIKTAINTANILTQEEKQIVLQLLNMKKLDSGYLEAVVKQSIQKQKASRQSDYGIAGILEMSSTSTSVWNDRIGNIESVLNGNMTVYDIAKQEQKRQKVLNESNRSAAKMAQTVIENNQQNLIDLNEALDKSNNAEGNVQAIQAGNAILGIRAQMQQDTNRLLAHSLAIQAAKAQKENLERAESQSVLESSQKLASQWLDD